MKKQMTKLAKALLMIVVLLGMQNSYAQSRNRMAALVQNAQITETFVPLNLFTVTTYEGAESFATGGTALLLDATKLPQLVQQKNNAITLFIPTVTGKTIQLDLIKADITTADFKVTTQNSSDANYEQGVYYRGIVNGDFTSIAAVSIFNDDIMILFGNNEGNFNLGAIRDHSGKYFLFNDHNALQKPSIECAVDYTLPYSDIEINKNGNQTTESVQCKVVKCYYEADFAMYQAFSSNVTTTANYVTSIFNVKSTLYANDGIPLEVSEIKVWTVTDPHASLTTTSAVNNSFISNIGTAYNGDFANFLTTRNLGGGIAQGFEGMCNKALAHCTSQIYTTFSPFPTYSWTIMVITHEMGHLFGSRHTHACVWNGNNTAIDGCAGYIEGTCAIPGIPSGGGTIMSYCHTQSVGINLNLGFGPQPAALLLGIFNAATCLGSNMAAPTGLTTTLITATSAKLKWNASPGATQYEVEYKLASDVNYTSLGTTTGKTKNLNGLSSNTTYKWRVKADCSPMSAPKTFTTTALAGCGVPTGTNSTNITATAAKIYWNAYVGATKYKTQYRKVGTSAWTTGNISTSFRNISGLTSATKYEWKVKSLCSGVWTAWSSKKTFTTLSNTPPTGYCASGGTNVSFEYIDNVTIGTLNNTSGSNAGYGDYTTLTTAAGLGTTVNLSVGLFKSNAGDNEYVSIFIDYNRDGDFDDAGETAYSANGTSTPFVGSFIIPGTANVGLTRMRVSMQFGSAPLTCGSYTYGEVEDYLINITSPLPLRTVDEMDETIETEAGVLTLAPNPASTSIQVSLDTEDGNYELQIYSMTGQLMKQLSFNGTTTNVDINDLPNGVYQLSVTSNENHLNKMFVKQ